MTFEPQKEHEWLQKLVGEWTYEGECPAGPDHPAQKAQGVETVRSLNGAWIVAEGKGEMPGGGDATSIMTLGYDPAKKHYVGSWIGSMMANQWIYVGTLDPSGKILNLDSEGPDMAVEGKIAKYRDQIEFKDDDNRLLNAFIMGDDGQWTQFMTTTYRRKK